MSESLLYTFEGLDGAGKTTNVELLSTTLNDKGYRTTKLSSPSRSILGTFIRTNMQEFNPELKEDLFLLDIQESIRSIPTNTDVVLFDRYVDSIFTSNEEANKETLAIKTVNLPKPHTTFLLNLNPENSWDREGQVSDHPLSIDWLNLKYNRYNELVMSEPERFQVVDATRDLDEVFNELLSTIMIDLIQLEDIEN